jgi:putative DNA methylase
MVPLVSSFMLSTKESKKAWIEPLVDPSAPDGYRFEVRTGPLSKNDEARFREGTIGRGAGGTCILSGASMPFSYVRREGQSNGLGVRLMAIVAESPRGRIYLSPTPEHSNIAASARPRWFPEGDLPNNPRNFNTPIYGLTTFSSLFTSRQLAAMTTFTDLVSEAGEQALRDSIAAGLDTAGTKLHLGGTGAQAYADALATYLAFAVSKASTRSCSLAIWEPGMGRLAGAIGRQAVPMQWSFAETNPLAGAGGDIAGTANSVAEIFNTSDFQPRALLKILQRREIHFTQHPS